MKPRFINLTGVELHNTIYFNVNHIQAVATRKDTTTAQLWMIDGDNIEVFESAEEVLNRIDIASR